SDQIKPEYRKTAPKVWRLGTAFLRYVLIEPRLLQLSRLPSRQELHPCLHATRLPRAFPNFQSRTAPNAAKCTRTPSAGGSQTAPSPHTNWAARCASTKPTSQHSTPASPSTGAAC